jgi:hypothetical protein
MGLAATPEGARRGARAALLLIAVRPDRGRLPPGHGCTGLQDRLLRARRPAADPKGRGDWATDDHVDRHGHRGRGRRSGGDSPVGRRQRDRAAQGIERLSGPAGVHEPASDPRHDRALRPADRVVRSHARHRGGRRGGGPRSLHRREAHHRVARRRHAGCRVLASRSAPSANRSWR